jgi:NOL1/NOP2/fmu family ribosome biogenesis protein
MQVTFLNQQEISDLEKILKINYGADFSFSLFLVFRDKNKIYLISKKFSDFWKKINNFSFFSLGLFFGELKKEKKILLSLEGAQMISKKTNKNIAFLYDHALKNFLLGFNILKVKEINCELENYILLRYKNDIIGLGQKRQKYIENLTLKTRRLSFF